MHWKNKECTSEVDFKHYWEGSLQAGVDDRNAITDLVILKAMEIRSPNKRDQVPAFNNWDPK